MKPIGILHVMTKLPVGGVENQLLTVLSKYDKKQFLPVVCSLSGKGEIGREIEARGIPLICLDKLGHKFRWSIVKDITDIIKRENIKIVRTHQYHANLYGRLAAKRTHVQCMIASVHNVYTRDKKFHRRLLNRYLARSTDRIVAVSDAVKKDIIKYDGIDENKITVIHNGVDVERFSSGQRTATRSDLGISSKVPVIGTVGRLTDQKGHKYLLEAVSELKNKFPDLRLLMAGDGPLRDELENYAKNLGIAQNVTFMGTRRDIPELLAAMDIFILPSLWEGLVNALIEAMAAGKPVIATNILPVREIVNTKDNGILVPAKNSTALALSIESLLNNRSLIDLFGEAARARAASAFSIDLTINKYTELFNNILKEKTMK